MAKKIKATKGKAPVAAGQKSISRQQLYLIGGVVVAAIALLVGIIIINQQSVGSAVSVDENTSYAGVPLSGQYANVRQIDRASDVAEGVFMGITEEGVPFFGDPNAPIALADMADFTCPHCADFSGTYERLIRDFGRSGDAVFYYYPVAAQSRAPESVNAARAALCAAQQGAFWEMHDELFRLHRAESPSAYTPSRLEEAADEIGLDGGKLRECLNSNSADAGMIAADRLATEVGANSTPTILYRLRGEATWRTIPIGGEIGGTRSYEQLAEIIRQANAQADQASGS